MSENTLYQRAYNFLYELIEKNGNIPTFKLPSERSLAIKFSASRRPIRLAYQKLIEQGYVENIHGKGYFIKKPIEGEKRTVTPSRAPTVHFIAPTVKTTFMQQILTGINQFCEEHFIDLSIKISNEQQSKENQLLRAAPLSRADGVLLFPNDSEYYSDELLKLCLGKYPITVIDRFLQPLNVSYVATDNHTAMVDAVKFLHQKKYKHFVYVTPPKSIASATEERINGFNHGLFKYYGMASAENLLTISGEAIEPKKKKVKEYLQRHPETEVMITMGVQATSIILAAAELGISIPEQLKLMVFDDEFSPTERAAIQPYIIQQDCYHIGYLATEALYNQIYGDMRVTVKKLPVKIIDCTKTK